MKKYLAAAAAFCVLASAAFAQPKVLKIGIFEPLSGDSGAIGKQEALGIRYANALTPTVDLPDGTYNIEFVYADNQSSTDKAPTAAQHLVSEGVSLVIGAAGSAVTIAGSPYFGDAGIPAITATATNPQVTLGNTHYFRVCFLDPFQGVVLANYAYKELGARSAYCLAELGNDYDIGLVHYFKEAFIALGGKVIDDTFPNGTSDFSSYLTNAANYGADVFFFPVTIAYSTQVIAQAASSGCKIPLLGSDIFDSGKVLEIIKGTDLSLVISAYYQEGAAPEFDAGYKAWLNSDSELLKTNGGNDIICAASAMGFDAYNVAIAAIKLAGSADPKKINEALWKTTLVGASGAIAFDEVGDALRDSAILKKADTVNGTWEFLKIQKID